jgi:hypothetical protein
MDTTTVRINEGMEVFGTDGKKLGKVSHVWMGATDAATDVASSGYFQVDQGGVLGLGAKHLYVPFSAVEDTTPDDSVTIECTGDDCAERFGHKPDFLNMA